MTVDAHVFPDYTPHPEPEPSIEAALTRMALYRTGIRSFTKAELQRDVLAYDEALRASMADRDVMCIRAAVRATEDQQSYIAQLEAVVTAAVMYIDGDASLNQLNDAVITYAENEEEQ